MGFQVSPGVNVTEIDLTTIVPAVATTSAGFAGVFQWGPVEEITLVDSVNALKSKFGGPDSDTYEYFFTFLNFLGYGNNLQVVRSVGTTAKNSADVASEAVLIKNETDFETGTRTGNFFGKYPGVLGNALAVYGFDGSAAVSGRLGVTLGTAATLGITIPVGTSSISISGTSGGIGGGALNLEKGDVINLPTGQKVTVQAIVTGSTLATISPVINTAVGIDTIKGATLESRYRNLFSSFDATTDDVSKAGGSNDLVNIAVVDYSGAWTGVAGSVLETFEGLSKATDGKKFSGESNHFKDVINEQSSYIWVENDSFVTTAAKSNNAFNNIATSATLTSANAYGLTLGGGVQTKSDGVAAVYTSGYSKFEDAETVDVSLILGGPADSTISSLIIDLCDARKDCVAFVSPGPVTDYQNKDAATATNNALAYRNTSLNKSSSYAVLDSGWKYMYDTFNGVYRYVPLNGDIAGLLARTEAENEAWFSPAGFNRGRIRGVVKLAFNPRQSHRDELYKKNINPVVSFPGEGTILFGDKTLQSKPSAFDRINVRRLFIILEKAIATAAKFQLFEFNDEFTRSQFRNLVVPFLRDVQARRGVTDFKVVCNESNNPGSVIDRNEFVADIFIKPNRSINFIQLNFIATASGVSFEEVGG